MAVCWKLGPDELSHIRKTRADFSRSCSNALFTALIMHHCLEIPEIALIIAEYVATTVKNNKVAFDRRNTLSFLKASRSFTGPASQILWKILTSPVPLLLTMPDDLLGVEAPLEDLTWFQITTLVCGLFYNERRSHDRHLTEV